MLRTFKLPTAGEFTKGDIRFRGPQFAASWRRSINSSTELDFRILKFNRQESIPLEGVVGGRDIGIFLCLEGEVFLFDSGHHLKPGDFVIERCTSLLGSPLLRSITEAQAVLAVLIIRNPTSTGGQVSPVRVVKNISDLPYDPRPGEISLKSLLLGSRFEKEVGFELVEMQPNSTIASHLHQNSVAFVYVVSGGGHFVVDHTRLKVGAECHGNIPTATRHTVEAGQDGMTFLSLQVPPIDAETGYIFCSGASITKDVRLV